MTSFEDFDERPSWRRRIISLVVAVAVIGGGGFAAWWYLVRDDTAPAAATVAQEATATTGNLVTSFQTTGTANPQLTSKVTFGTTGQVVSTSVALGDKVTEGQELARLDDKTAQRTLSSAQNNLAAAQLKVTTLTQPPTAADVASAQAAISSAQSQLATAQNNLATAQGGPAATDLATADAAILSAQNALTSAKNGVDTSFTGLLNAQRNYCSTDNVQYKTDVCLLAQVPLSDLAVSELNQEIRNPLGTGSAQSAVVSAASGFLSANNGYTNAKNGVVTAQNNLDSANQKKAALYDPPTAVQLAQLNAAVTSAQASVLTAQAKLTQLLAGPTATDLQSAQQSVDSAQIAVETAQDAITSLVMKAPFDGVVSAATLNVGDQASADSVTITNPDAMRVDLTVSETDLPNVKKGEYGIATFDALPGNTYVLKVTTVGTAPTVTQGVVTYPVQAMIMRAADLQADAAELQPIAAALLSLGTGGTGRAALGGAAAGGANGGGANAANGGANTTGTPRGARNGQGAAANGTPQASRTPSASRTPGANGTQGANGGFAGGGAFLTALGNAPLPNQGMSATVIMLSSIKTNVLLVPTGAVKRTGTQRYVVVKHDDGTTANVNVTVGGSDDTNTEVVSGIAEGTKVVLGATTAATGTTPAAGNGNANGFGGGAGGFLGGGGAAGGAGGARGGGANAAPGGVR